MKQLLNRFLLVASFGLTGMAMGQYGTAPDFTVTDIEGNTHQLYADILDQGKIAVVQIAATWCPPCWVLHTSGALQGLHEAFGPDGTDQLRVIIYEADPTTTLNQLMGMGGNTMGDWTEGVTHPIVNESPLSLDMGIWRPFGYPTVNVVRPSDYEIVLDTRNAQTFEAQMDAINAAGIDGIVLGQPIVSGCTYPLASNFDSEATEEDGSCFFLGCTNPDALNYQMYANVEDGSCDFGSVGNCPADLDGDGLAATQDLLLFLSAFGQACVD